ncbi:MAG: hypothetical protein ACJ72Z_12820 [Pyrinomonadaceae bacterium]
MAKQLDNSLVQFSRRSSTTPQLFLSAVILICLLGGLVYSISIQQWPGAAVFAVGALGTVAYAWFSIDQYRRLVATLDQSRVDWEAALPEVQRQNLKLEVLELTKVLDVETEQVGDLQSAYIVAEDLALRQIQQEENVPLLRHVGVGGVPFDAVFVKDGILNCCEVSFLVAPDLRQDKIDAMMRKVKRVMDSLEERKVTLIVRMMLILITQLSKEDDERLRSVLNTRRFSATPVDIDIRLLDFEALQRIYVTD